MAAAVVATGCLTLVIVKHIISDRFVNLPKRWFVERTLASISGYLRLARVFERNARTVIGFVDVAKTGIMLKRLTRPSSCH